MTVSTISSKVQYTADGVQTVFIVPFPFLQESDLQVYLGTVQATLSTDYTATGAGSASGGTITLLTAPTVGELVTILRVVSYTQPIDFINNPNFDVNNLEAALDHLTEITQQLKEDVSRALKVDVGVILPDLSYLLNIIITQSALSLGDAQATFAALNGLQTQV